MSSGTRSAGGAGRTLDPEDGMHSLVVKLQAEVEARKRPRRVVVAALRRGTLPVVVGAFAFLVGARAAATAEGADGLAWRGEEEGVVDLQRAELERLRRIYAHSAAYGIPADLAESIEDIARAEGIAPEVAFGLVRAESEFNRRAVSRAGAVGLTQLMPSTARYFQADLGGDLFDRETNLRIGFRYLRSLIDRYDGDLRLALLAYNRGPERVDQLLRAGRDPDNGYVRLVLGADEAP